MKMFMFLRRHADHDRSSLDDDGLKQSDLGRSVSDAQRAQPDAAALREDLGKEYYSILEVVSDYDQRFLTIKGWSVTLSLVALGLGFKEQHAFYFALAAFSGLSFWVLEALAKRHQLRYYSRMRDIEVACYYLNRVPLPELGEASAPRIDMSWAFSGYDVENGKPRPALDRKGREVTDWRTDPPWRRKPEEVHWLLLRPWRMPHVLLPHALAVVVGLALCLGALLGVPYLREIPW